MKEDKVVNIHDYFINEIKVEPNTSNNVVDFQMRRRMAERMNELRKQYTEEEDIIGIFVSEFENAYKEDEDIEVYARNLLEKIRKEIGSR